jgi:hypothetical protein
VYDMAALTVYIPYFIVAVSVRYGGTRCTTVSFVFHSLSLCMIWRHCEFAKWWCLLHILFIAEMLWVYIMVAVNVCFLYVFSCSIISHLWILLSISNSRIISKLGIRFLLATWTCSSNFYLPSPPVIFHITQEWHGQPAPLSSGGWPCHSTCFPRGSVKALQLMHFVITISEDGGHGLLRFADTCLI